MDQAEEDVLGADVRVVQEACFLLSQDDDPSGPVSESFEHKYRLWGAVDTWAQCTGGRWWHTAVHRRSERAPCLWGALRRLRTLGVPWPNTPRRSWRLPPSRPIASGSTERCAPQCERKTPTSTSWPPT